MAFKDDVLAKMLDSRVSLKRSNLFKTWAKQNPGENAMTEAYWLNGGAPPSVATEFGKAQVKDGEAYWMLKNTLITVGSSARIMSPSSAAAGAAGRSATASSGSGPAGTLFFQALHEGSLWSDEWGTAPNGSDGTGTNGLVQVVTSENGMTPRSGSKVLKTYISTANRASWSPTTLQATLVRTDVMTPSQIGLGQDVYAGGSFYLVPGFQYANSLAHVALMEWHGNYNGQAPIHLGIFGNGGQVGQFYYDLHRDVSGYNPVFQFAFGANSTGAWYDYVIRTKWSNGTDGVVQIWFKLRDGTPMTDANLKHTYNGATWNLANSAIYPMLGCYRGVMSNEGTVYHDSFRVGTTRAIVDPGNYS